MRRFAQPAHKLIPGALALASFALYLCTLAPDVVDADGGEFQFAAWNFGFVHPTGYPLFLMLGGAFQHLVPIGNPAFRLNLFNAFIAAFVVAIVYLVALELARHRVASIIAAAAFGLTRTFWYDASAAETYALNAFFIALLLYLAWRWQTEPTARKFAAFCFAFGLALTHHRSTVLWLPAFVVFFLIPSFKFQVPSSLFTVYCRRPPASRLPLPAACLLPSVACLLPLLLYLYIPLRAPASPYWVLPFAPEHDLILYDHTLTGFINYTLGRTFQSEIGWDAVSVARLVAFPHRLLDQFGALGVALGAFGFGAMLWRREWARLALLLIGFLTTILFASLYHIGDIAHYYIPAYLVWAMWMGLAMAWVLHRVGRFTFRALPISLSSASCLLLAACLLVPQFVSNLSHADRSHETQPREQWTRILAAPIPPEAILVSNDRDEMMPLWYIQYVENTRRDLLGLFPLITPEYPNIARVTDAALSTRRPVFFIKAMPGIEIKYRVTAFDGLWRVSQRTETPHVASGATLAHRVRVLGYDATREADALRVAIYWSPLAKLDRDYTTFVHLLDARGDKIAQGNDHQVGGAFYPTTLWEVGESLRDEFTLPVSSNITAGDYRLLVGMYSQPAGEMLGEPIEIGVLEIK